MMKVVLLQNYSFVLGLEFGDEAFEELAFERV